jgi:hypothetical protein
MISTPYLDIHVRLLGPLDPRRRAGQQPGQANFAVAEREWLEVLAVEPGWAVISAHGCAGRNDGFTGRIA